MSERYAVAKRAMDIILATLALMASAPLSLAVALAIRCSSDGPILYAGRRVGRNGEFFRMYKFRTMFVDADRRGPAITLARDPRVTPIGRLLRAGKLDELPQFLNVLRGDMSLVGPRPEAPEYVALYDHHQRLVLSVRPGITGPAQLRFRHEERLLGGEGAEQLYRTAILPDKLRWDLSYVRHHSILGDIQLLAATCLCLFRRHQSESVGL